MSIKNILIVGGGTSGLISALILKNRFPKLKIDIVKSDNIGIIGVGEGTTEHWKEFIDFCGISIDELIKETDATFKYGIMFESWKKEKYFHNVTGEILNIKYGQYLGGYAYSIINNLKPKEYTNGHCFENKIINNVFPNQFHFNTFKLNSFLLKKCKEININIFTDEILKINNDNKKIINLESKNKKYKYDFYIYCTGFKKLLISKLGGKWISYKEYLPMNEAIAFPTEDTKEYFPYTLSKAMNFGWMWRIPTYGRWGNGYVFNNKYINAEQAKKECETYLGYKVEIAKNIKFEAGALEKPWLGNCVAIGLCSSFIEPLEATSIGTSIQQSFLLMHLLINNNQSDIDLYNEKFKLIVENIRDFVLLHYIVKKKNSIFWKNLKLKIPESLNKNLKKWKNRLPIREDFNGNYLLFYEHNFAVILKELNLINKYLIKKEYNELNKEIINDIEFRMNNHINFFNTNLIDHKQFLNERRNTKN
jgi:tryptophan halogenase